MAVAVSTLYLDESGSRHPDVVLHSLPEHGRDWFGMGGVLIDRPGYTSAMSLCTLKTGGNCARRRLQLR